MAADHSPDWKAGYAIGYMNGESSVTADIECFLDEQLGLEVTVGWSGPLLALKARLDELEARLDDQRQAALERLD